MLAHPGVPPAEQPTLSVDPMPEVRHQNYRNLVVVHNPVSTNARCIEPQLHALYDTEGRWATKQPIIETTADDSFLEQLDRDVIDNSDVVISGGDGAVKRVLQYLHAKDLRGVRVVLVGAGNKNDMANMVNGKDHVADPLHIFDQFDRGEAKAVGIFPLEATFDEGGEQEHKELAFYSLGLGATAITARLVNAQHFRDRQRKWEQWKVLGLPLGKFLRLRRIGEYMQAGDAVMRSVPFRFANLSTTPEVPPARANILATSETSNRLQKLLGHTALLPYKWRNFRTMHIDTVFSAGARMAGGDINMPTTLGNPVEFAMNVTPNLVHRVLGSVAILKLGLSTTVSGTYRTLLRDRVRTQADGEWLGIMPAGVMSVRRSQSAITVLALRAGEISPPNRNSRGRARSAILPAHEQETKARPQD